MPAFIPNLRDLTELFFPCSPSAHELPNVFSFFLPEFSPSGQVAQASLVSPEAQVLTGPRIIDLLNGVFGLIKFGLHPCYGGFGGYGVLAESSEYDAEFCDELFGSRPNEAKEPFEGVAGKLSYQPTNIASADNTINELATILTAGRLSESSRVILKQLYSFEENKQTALARVQALMASTPEFHTSNIVRKNGQTRPAPEQAPPSGRPYKAVVYLLLTGGVDSYNMLAPHTCTERNTAGLTLREQYNMERTSIALSDAERTRVIDATNQPCSQFAIHQNLGALEYNYKAGDLAFFANAGVINKPVTKDDYFEVTRTQLFVSRHTQHSSQFVARCPVLTIHVLYILFTFRLIMQ